MDGRTWNLKFFFICSNPSIGPRNYPQEVALARIDNIMIKYQDLLGAKTSNFPRKSRFILIIHKLQLKISQDGGG